MINYQYSLDMIYAYYNQEARRSLVWSSSHAPCGPASRYYRLFSCMKLKEFPIFHPDFKGSKNHYNVKFLSRYGYSVSVKDSKPILKDN